MRDALVTLPWVEKSSVVTNTSNQTARFAVADKEQFDLDAVRDTVHRLAGTKYNVTRVVEEP